MTTLQHAVSSPRRPDEGSTSQRSNCGRNDGPKCCPQRQLSSGHELTLNSALVRKTTQPHCNLETLSSLCNRSPCRIHHRRCRDNALPSQTPGRFEYLKRKGRRKGKAGLDACARSSSGARYFGGVR